MPISSFDSTGRSGGVEVADAHLLGGAARGAPTGPVIRRARKNGQDERDHERRQRPPATSVVWIWRKAASSFSRLRRATAAPTSWSRRRADRQQVGEVGLAPETASGSGPIVLPWRRTACTRSGRRSIASAAARPSGPSSRPRARRLRRLGRPSPRPRGRRPACSGAARGCAPRRRRSGRPRRSRPSAARRPRARARRRRGRACRPRARSPRSARPGARRRSSARPRGRPSRGGAGPCARAPTPCRCRRDQKVRAHARGLLALQRVEDGRRVRARRSPERASTSSRSCRRCSRRRRARGGARRSGSAGTTPSPGPAFFRSSSIFASATCARAVGRDRDGAADGDQDQERHRQEDLERQRELRRLRRAAASGPSAGARPRSAGAGATRRQ